MSFAGRDDERGESGLSPADNCQEFDDIPIAQNIILGLLLIVDENASYQLGVNPELGDGFTDR